ncbi:Integrase core domain protein [Pigmentiphaga humi]|uniref:Integrase core domain protein n=1 Tax=Pigmentiphaga humi TaxID=2478468 RepID=A0A3P4B1Y5_9BURK|nr:IS481 family transposase [Pigmentiphaga humi]VCU70293.1 Integrase core domain protein [Pigmentiphaga humi]
MSWSPVTVTDQREEFVRLASTQAVSLSELCRRFGISRKTGYKWLERWQQQGLAGLADRTRRPRHSPGRTPAWQEDRVLAVRSRHPAWGARKIAHVLGRDQQLELAPSTVNAILRRHGCISPAASQAAVPWERFEHEAPNDLWQMDFKGHFATDQSRCHPLTVLDDHSRYSLVLQALGQERFEPVQACLQAAFERYGLPGCINTDNGPPWRAAGQPAITRLGLWLIRLGVTLSHSRPRHPQTNGKDERFHRTLKAEVLGTRRFRSLAHVQQHFDQWRRLYNHERPHQALGLHTPAQRYRSSTRPMPSVLPPIEYAPDDLVRKVQSGGWIHLHGRRIRLYEGLRGLPVALRPQPGQDGVFDLYYCHQRIASIDLTLD